MMKYSLLSVIIGGVISFETFKSDYFQFSLIDKFLTFAFFVVVPLVIKLLDKNVQSSIQQKFLQYITILQFPAALLSLGSLMSNKTWELNNPMLFGLLSLGWLLLTFLLALYGVLLILEKKKNVEEIAIGAGLIYFFIGGVWYTLYQFQVTFLHVDPKISALSSVHFHYSSAIVPIFIGMLGRIWVKKSWYNWLVGIDIAGPILIAFGIIFSKWIENMGVIIFACNITIYNTYLLLKMRKHFEQNAGKLCLTLSSLAFYCIVALSAFYPLARRFYSITILDMIPIYGSLHAFGFVLFGLIGWIIVMSGNLRKQAE
ncbi:YndJ family transporter [Bacillus tianshenii]|nr:YndJ family transporter [Bacillus tianshenii]